MMDDPFLMVVAIVAIAVGAGVVNNWLKLKSTQGTDADLLKGLDALRSDVARLSDRVATLEKITTDSDQRLSREIDQLR